MHGGIGKDTLRGGSGDDFLYGGAHNDYLVGGPGQDYLNGGGGKDKLEDKSGDESTVFVDIDGGDEWFRGDNEAPAFFILDTSHTCDACTLTTIDKVFKYDHFMIGDAGSEIYLNAGEDLWFISEPSGNGANVPTYDEPEVLENVMINYDHDSVYFELIHDWTHDTKYAEIKIR